MDKDKLLCGCDDEGGGGGGCDEEGGGYVGEIMSVSNKYKVALAYVRDYEWLQ